MIREIPPTGGIAVAMTAALVPAASSAHADSGWPRSIPEPTSAQMALAVLSPGEKEIIR
jgi:hypothetical protein